MYKELTAEVLRETAHILKNGGSFNQVNIGLTTLGSEVALADLIRGAQIARSQDPGLNVVIIGPENDSDLPFHQASTEDEVHHLLEGLLDKKELDGVVTMHYPFPIGVSTVGKIISPARGKPVYIATSTGTSATNRVQAMIKNAVYGISVAKADGIAHPTVGILNVEGARQVERHLNSMQEKGYDFTWGESLRGDKGHVLRGNDLIMGSVDVVVTDTLTGNILLKLFGAFNSGGDYETTGYGYGPGVGEDFDRLICILSRASGSPVIANAINYCATMARTKLSKIAHQEITRAGQAGWIIDTEKPAPEAAARTEITPPPAKIVDAQIPGIDILELDDAVQVLWQNQIFASSGMGCTGPVILVAAEDRDQAVEVLKTNNYL